MSQATQSRHSYGVVLPESSRAERFSSYDVAAFEVPGGREEVWRFTPMKRLRGLHDGSASATGEGTITHASVDGVTIEQAPRTDERIGAAGIPGDRIAAQAWSAFANATILTVARETRVAETVLMHLAGPGAGETA